MAATVYGDGEWSMLDEVGLYAQSFEYDMSIQEFYIPGVSSEDVAGATFGQEASFTINGFIKTTETLTAKLGVAITVANAVEFADYMEGYTTGGQSFLTGIKQGGEVRNFQSLDLTGKFKPFLENVAV